MAKKKLRANTHKGNAFEEEVAEFFTKAGAIVETTKLNRRFTRKGWRTDKGDFFTVFDHIVIYPGRSPVIFIQSTSSRGAIREKMRKIDDKMGLPGIGREYVVATRDIEGKGLEFWRKLHGYCLMDSWEIIPLEEFKAYLGIDITQGIS